MMNETQTEMFSAPTTRAIAIDDRVARNGRAGSVTDAREMTEMTYEVAFDDGGRGLYFARELTRIDVHALSWSCACETCTTARRTIGRSMAGA